MNKHLTAINQQLTRNMLVAQKHSPRILFAVGIGAVLGGTYLACRATMRLDAKLESFKTEVDEASKHPVNPSRKLAGVYFKNSFELIKLYSPAIVLTSVGIAALTTSHVTLTRRNASLTAAYSALSMSYDAYRAKIKEELGDEKELELYRESTVSAVRSTEHIQTGHKIGGVEHSMYARIFDESNVNWQKDPELNKVFLLAQERYANHLLQARGHIFLNEVYDALGFDHSQAGSVVGWVINDDGSGDNYIDFGIFRDGNERFVNGYERSVILDFNVDGIIWDKIGR